MEADFSIWTLPEDGPLMSRNASEKRELWCKLENLVEFIPCKKDWFSEQIDKEIEKRKHSKWHHYGNYGRSDDYIRKNWAKTVTIIWTRNENDRKYSATYNDTMRIRGNANRGKTQR